MMGEIFVQERPPWCPHPDCQFLRIGCGLMCCGKLPRPVEHDRDFNTHRFCLYGAGDGGGVFDLQVNKTDLFWFDMMFDHLRKSMDKKMISDD